MSKPINQMNQLSDMARFPWTVHLGASTNIVFSVWLTYHVHRVFQGSFLIFLPFALVLIGLNLLPVVWMRAQDTEVDDYRPLEKMDFFRDQHRFSTWVYAVASGNMLFWTVFAWWVFSFAHSQNSLLATQLIAFAVTYVPFWRSILTALRTRAD